ncbi:XdhC Rossmann domain-containing protein [Modestobacter sp. DSM 44400]|uniref:XdhC family protein n=1 Tax=Modestobacter sp. DSM 44400 TaxID=1550230 RepID=UPI00089540FE|nr:XdhC family protein [Modestobacter sp. DSM 44400]SDX47341.1 XdhC Rossmann domain-containing protein [Modestobacter sp. DSM 44400]
MTGPDPSCGVAHGSAPAGDTPERVLVAGFASPVAGALLRIGAELGWRPVLVEPDVDRPAPGGLPADVVRVASVAELPAGLGGPGADVVVTDHHRAELGVLLRDALVRPVRWVGIMGNPRHEGPHVAALAALGVPAAEIARVHRPIGLDVGSRSPGEIAVATLAGLLADRNGRPGGFFPPS